MAKDEFTLTPGDKERLNTAIAHLQRAMELEGRTFQTHRIFHAQRIIADVLEWLVVRDL